MPVLRRGVDNTVRDLEDSAHGGIARSWVSPCANRTINPEQLARLLSARAESVISCTDRNGTGGLEVLAEHLPRVIDHLTRDGRVPDSPDRSVALEL